MAGPASPSALLIGLYIPIVHATTRQGEGERGGVGGGGGITLCCVCVCVCV